VLLFLYPLAILWYYSINLKGLQECLQRKSVLCEFVLLESIYTCVDDLISVTSIVMVG